jgi:SWI/SNF-related matrix-associated actin-dependent regulator of chromatin subfamily A3
LPSKHRWCLTGTPIQNKLDDLGALIKFLRIPYLDESSNFRNSIVTPIEKGQSVGITRLRSLLSCICLRRVKEVLKLPEPDEKEVAVELLPTEKQGYCNIGEKYRQAIQEAVCGRNSGAAYKGIFQAILRLRIFCNHGLLTNNQLLSPELSTAMDEAFSLLQQNDEAVCGYCSCDVSSIAQGNDEQSGIITDCSHLLCAGCLSLSTIDVTVKRVKTKKLRCPVCNNVSGFHHSEASQGDHGLGLLPKLSEPSSKFVALINNIKAYGKTEKRFVSFLLSWPYRNGMITYMVQYCVLVVENDYSTFGCVPKHP